MSCKLPHCTSVSNEPAVDVLEGGRSSTQALALLQEGSRLFPAAAHALQWYQTALLELGPRPVTAGRRTLFIVLEGLDGAGKSTLAEGLGQRLAGASLYCTPPRDALAVRSGIDELPDQRVRRAFYFLCNYLVASRIQYEAPEIAVCDRYLFSTVAYAVLQANDSPPLESWPNDLLRPNLIMFLSVHQRQRQQRLLAREEDNALTREEALLGEADRAAQLDNIYRHLALMLMPDRFQCIDAGQEKEDVLNAALMLAAGLGRQDA